MEPKRPARYRLYIDESGDHTYNLLDESAHRYLALLGVWFRQEDDYIAFADGLEKLKRIVFGPRPDEPVVFHRSDIIARRGPFGLLKDATINEAFENGLLTLVNTAQFTMCCVVIDKQRHLKGYNSPFHPYHYCLAAMLDRYSGWLNYWNAVGDVMAEARGSKEDQQLKAAYRRVYESGTLMFDEHHHQRALTTKELKFKAKTDNIAGLQLADMLAYPVKQAWLTARGLAGPQHSQFGRQLCQASWSKFNIRRYDRHLDGYGRVWL